MNIIWKIYNNILNRLNIGGGGIGLGGGPSISASQSQVCDDEISVKSVWNFKRDFAFFFIHSHEIFFKVVRRRLWFE